MTDERPFYTIQTLATRLNVSKRTVRRIISEGRIAVYRVDGAVRIDPVDVDAYLAERRVPRNDEQGGSE